MNLALEHACLSAWPARERESRFGWEYLASRGRSLRINAIWPLGWSGETALDAAIEDAARWLGERNLPLVFKVSDGLSHPGGLVDALRARGLAPAHETLVLQRELSSLTAAENIQMGEAPDEGFWAPMRASAPNEEDFIERQEAVLRIGDQRVFAQCGEAIGLGVLSGELLGVYLMRTAPAARRQGLARKIVRGLLSWGAGLGATKAYLQVEQDNAPACALYEREGFSVAYRYAYWSTPR